MGRDVSQAGARFILTQKRGREIKYTLSDEMGPRESDRLTFNLSAAAVAPFKLRRAPFLNAFRNK
jgi:hypothetical protein